MNCVNLTLKMRRCRRPVRYINLHSNGMTSEHCAQHWAFFYGYPPAMPTSIIRVIDVKKKSK